MNLNSNLKLYEERLKTLAIGLKFRIGVNKIIWGIMDLNYN